MLPMLIGFVLSGAVCGFISACLGFGGALLGIPVLFWQFRHLQIPSEFLMHITVGTSLSIMLMTGLNAALSHQRHGGINWTLIKRIAPGIAAGALLGTFLAANLQSKVLRWLFVSYIFFTILRMIIKTIPSNQTLSAHDITLPSLKHTTGFGFITGFVCVLIGIGGGILTVPFFRKLKISASHAVAMASVLTLPVALIGSIAYMYAGAGKPLLPPHCIGYVYWPAVLGFALGSFFSVPLGAKLSYRIPEHRLVKIQIALMTITALLMLRS